jgi:polysaccharide deacetylase family protein (PEP-CTERM system associated)
MHQNSNGTAKLVVTVDVEDWPQSTWDHSLQVTGRAARNTERLLDLLSRHGKVITMFVLGKFAECFPDTVKRIASAGHEVASHGYGHVEIFQQTASQFREDVHRAKSFLEDLIGKPILGYRAPDFSILLKSLWALEILAELGFQYDSSIFPIKEGRYGIGAWPAHPVRVRLPSDRSIVELPPATLTWLGRQWPVAGGGYHRLLPWPVIRMAISDCLRGGGPFIAYCHPYEFDDREFSALDLKIPLRTRLHQKLGRRGFGLKFERMIETFDVIQAAQVTSDSRCPDYFLKTLGPGLPISKPTGVLAQTSEPSREAPARVPLKTRAHIT